MMAMLSLNLLQQVTPSRQASLFLHMGSRLLVDMRKLLDQPLAMVNTQQQHNLAILIHLLLLPMLLHITRAK